jgi:tetratricopeptide (TPR) repeat protein
MKKYLILIAVIIFYSVSTEAQKIPDIDSLRIDDLKKQLPNLQGTKKVDVLNDLAREYIYQKRKNDSVEKYARQAYELSMQIEYKYGLALSLLKLKGSKEEKDKRRQQAIQIGKEIKNNVILGFADFGGKESSEYFRKAGDEEDEAEVNTWLGAVLIYEGKYEEAFPYCERAVMLAKKKRTHNLSLGPVLMQFSLNNISDLYRVAGDYETALEYLHKARQVSIEYKQDWTMDDKLALLYNKTGQYDSALFYLQKNSKANPNSQDSKKLLGETYLLAKNYDKAITLFKEGIDLSAKNYDRLTAQYKADNHIIDKPKKSINLFYNQRKNGFLMSTFLNMAKAYSEKGNHAVALKYIKQSDHYRYGDEIIASSAESLMHDYDLLSSIYHNARKNDSAYNYLKKYIALKDSIDNKKALWRLNMKLSNYKSAALNAKKEADLAMSEQKLKQQVFIRNGLGAGLLLILIIGFFAFRNLHLKRKNEKLQLQKDFEVHKLKTKQKETDLQRQAVELEMQALRAQMNPHFIFNCLSSINRFIFKNDNKTASDYLTRFSRLIRMVLVNSQKKLITLEDDLEMLRLYLDMERMRFKNGFDYSITTNNTIDAGAIFIPPLLLQPFCENAIWHGLMHKDGQGHLNISITEENRFLNCAITDDGVGREKAATYKSKSAEREKSLGLKITSARLALLNKEQNKETAYQIEDVLNEEGDIAGTKVNLKIFYKEFLEEIEQHA